MRKNLLAFKKYPGVGESLGVCEADTFSMANWANVATERLLYAPEQSEQGFWGGWAEMAFTVSRCDPFLVTPRGVARVIAMDVCTWPVQMKNQFWEYLRFGFGRLPKFNNCRDNCLSIACTERDTVSSFSPIKPPDKTIFVYIRNPADADKRVLIQGKDGNDQTIYSMDNGVQVEGEFVTLGAPFVSFGQTLNRLTGIQKDVTLGPLDFYEVSQITGDQRLILTMEPSETVADYRRYFLNNLPKNCGDCTVDRDSVSLTAMVKLDFIPVATDTDWLLIQNIPALFNECQSIRYSRMDSVAAKQASEMHHKKAIGLINGELVHRTGKEPVAIEFKPFGTASLARLGFNTYR